MKKLIMITIIGFIAQLIDGSLGMAYGVTSSSLLLLYGFTPAVASASVHLAEVATTAASGIAHYKFGNIDRQAVMKLIVPGSIGAFLGACFLSNLPGHLAKPYVSLFLLLLGVYILLRFLINRSTTEEKQSIELSKPKAISLGFIAGFADATGGGGWGPITTPVLLTQKGIPARKVIGTVDTSEFAIAVSATLGFLLSLGWENFNWLWVFSLMAGGIFAAPIAAWLVRIIPSSLLGVIVGGFIILTNLHPVLEKWSSNNEWNSLIYAVIIVGWILSTTFMIRKLIKNKTSSTRNN